MRGREERRGGRRGLIEGDLLSLVVLPQELNPVSEKRRKDRKKRIGENKYSFVPIFLIQPLLAHYYKTLTSNFNEILRKFIIAI